MSTRRKTRPVPVAVPTPVLEATTTVGPEDIEGLPQLFRMFAGEVRDSLARLEQIIPPIARIEQAIADIRGTIHALDGRVRELERGRHEHEARIATLESLRTA